MPREDEARLLDMLLAARDARDFASGLSRQQFAADKRTHSAVCLKLEILGEAARGVTPAFKAACPQIPWESLMGLRNRIVHEYFRLDLNILWQIVQTELPVLVAQIEPLVPPPPSDPDPEP